jgi:hypothetical protein
MRAGEVIPVTLLEKAFLVTNSYLFGKDVLLP